ncbi:xanthine dehydrogenase family protein subunit M [Aurantimonas sp. 22II-16-19i]|uniref:FAD binding domain-containing protein n=1 Tax=Aurantimonas sp. 22II-16-19i TaxID=1317114 RepID=UPI0009F7C37A|nr:xanthine dehydrogenase family protein subunit M [Aurantimonas sp. 22II-16-19i]ORE93295.1 molybdopterin dehydrogenase, FAD-binding protein [Aurantimonas sp. 22II-16-19i]
MREFTYLRASNVAAALNTARADGGSRYLGGGTNLVDLMRENIETPDTLIDVSCLSSAITVDDDSRIMIGAAATNTAVAEHPLIRQHHPMLSRAILSGASGQIRNMATVGGNLLQRTRCLYFYDDAARCNKRLPGDGCDAVDGFNRMHAIFGATPSCVATHPSDMCVALAALDAVVHIKGYDGARTVPLVDFHRLPGESPDVETILADGELITAVELPPPPPRAIATYRKVRDRASYAFALVSVAALIQVEDGRIVSARLALGGVAHKPWRAHLAEQVLEGAPVNAATFGTAAAAAIADARALKDNEFKIELAKNTVFAVLTQLGDRT